MSPNAANRVCRVPRERALPHILRPDERRDARALRHPRRLRHARDHRRPIAGQNGRTPSERPRALEFARRERTALVGGSQRQRRRRARLRRHHAPDPRRASNHDVPRGVAREVIPADPTLARDARRHARPVDAHGRARAQLNSSRVGAVYRRAGRARAGRGRFLIDDDVTTRVLRVLRARFPSSRALAHRRHGVAHCGVVHISSRARTARRR